ncbi:867_t:CDS:2 [Paraglomus brasilianum]|uniref:867_t:CDS:1 n=1 Tax=Paraglomus brasilianum TaxID=144538 RepID=A0A9N9F0Q2_9GLOM|nr:867_t:CDS:2 [Paraglomus brasilianum]
MADILASTTSAVGDGKVSDLGKIAVFDVVRRHFPPEFINRIDDMIIFDRLSRLAPRDIVDVRLREVQQRLSDKQITVDVLVSQPFGPKDPQSISIMLIEGSTKSHETARVRTVKTDTDEE